MRVRRRQMRPPLLMPGMNAICINPKHQYHMFTGIVQRVTDGKAQVLFEGGNWDKSITFRCDDATRVFELGRLCDEHVASHTQTAIRCTAECCGSDSSSCRRVMYLALAEGAWGSGGSGWRTWSARRRARPHCTRSRPSSRRRWSSSRSWTRHAQPPWPPTTASSTFSDSQLHSITHSFRRVSHPAWPRCLRNLA